MLKRCAAFGQMSKMSPEITGASCQQANKSVPLFLRQIQHMNSFVSAWTDMEANIFCFS